MSLERKDYVLIIFKSKKFAYFDPMCEVKLPSFIGLQWRLVEVKELL